MKFSTWMIVLLLLAILGVSIAVLVQEQKHHNKLSLSSEDVRGDIARVEEMYNTDWSATSPIRTQNVEKMDTVRDMIEKMMKKIEMLNHDVAGLQSAIDTHKNEWVSLENSVLDVQDRVTKIPYQQALFEQRGKLLHATTPEDVNVSVLVPIYNGSEYFDSGLRSILNQTVPPFEVLIGVNGHGFDSAVENLVRRVVHEQKTNITVKVLVYENGGKVLALNAMVKESSGTHIALMDVDDEWLPEKLERQVEIVKKYHVDVVGTQCVYFGDRTGSPNLVYGFIRPVDFLQQNQMVNSSVLLHKDWAVWNSDFTLGLEDYELWLRLVSSYAIFYNVETPLVKHRIHLDSFYNTKNQEQAMERLRQLYFPS